MRFVALVIDVCVHSLIKRGIQHRSRNNDKILETKENVETMKNSQKTRGGARKSTKAFSTKKSAGNVQWNVFSLILVTAFQMWPHSYTYSVFVFAFFSLSVSTAKFANEFARVREITQKERRKKIQEQKIALLSLSGYIMLFIILEALFSSAPCIVYSLEKA